MADLLSKGSLPTGPTFSRYFFAGLGGFILTLLALWDAVDGFHAALASFMPAVVVALDQWWQGRQEVKEEDDQRVALQRSYDQIFARADRELTDPKTPKDRCDALLEQRAFAADLLYQHDRAKMTATVSRTTFIGPPAPDDIASNHP